MAITFESIRDPYGLGEAGNAIGDAMMQKSMMEAQQKRKIADEERQRNQQIQNSQTLGTTLKDMMPAEGQQWDQDRVASFMAQALESGASMNDVLNAVKGLQANKPKASAVAQTPFSKEMSKKNATMLQNYTEEGRTAKTLLSNWDELEKAINDPERTDNAVGRYAKGLPGASVTFGESDQIINTYAKDIIANFTKMKDFRLTDAKLRWLEGIAPAPWKSKEANQQASAHFKKMAQIQEAYGDIANNIANAYIESGIDVPANFGKLIEDAIEPLRDEIDQMYKMSTENAKNPQKTTEVGSKFEKMPNAKDYEGAEITDSKGNRFVSNGTKWSKVK